MVDLEDEFEEIEPPKTPPPRVSAAGHSLRQHGDLKLSLQARENGDRRVLKRRKITKQRSKDIVKASAPKTLAAPKTARNEIRDYINTETAGKRSKFFIAKKDLFIPLLPDGNHIQRLISQRGQDTTDESIPYEVIEKQPTGWVCFHKLCHNIY